MRLRSLAIGIFAHWPNVGLCLGLNACDRQSFYEPRAGLIQRESKSRGRESKMVELERFAGELAALKRKWATDLGCHPFRQSQISPSREQSLIWV